MSSVLGVHEQCVRCRNMCMYVLVDVFSVVGQSQQSS